MSKAFIHTLINSLFSPAQRYQLSSCSPVLTRLESPCPFIVGMTTSEALPPALTRAAMRSPDGESFGPLTKGVDEKALIGSFSGLGGNAVAGCAAAGLVSAAA